MRVACPKCKTVRIVQEGKSKKCRKCGTVLTSMSSNPKKNLVLSAADILEKFPEGAKEIKNLAIQEFKETFSSEGEDSPSVDKLVEYFPELADEIAKIATDNANKEYEKKHVVLIKNVEDQLEVAISSAAADLETQKVAAAESLKVAVEKAVEKIGELSVNKFTEQFPKLAEKVGKSAVKEAKN